MDKSSFCYLTHLWINYGRLKYNSFDNNLGLSTVDFFLHNIEVVLTYASCCLWGGHLIYFFLFLLFSILLCKYYILGSKVLYSSWYTNKILIYESSFLDNGYRQWNHRICTRISNYINCDKPKQYQLYSLLHSLNSYFLYL